MSLKVMKNPETIDNEWEQYLNACNHTYDDDEDVVAHTPLVDVARNQKHATKTTSTSCIKQLPAEMMIDVDEDGEIEFDPDADMDLNLCISGLASCRLDSGQLLTAPVPTDIYISTKSKIEYLNIPIDIKQLFWDVKVMPYSTPTDCVIKKQIKFNSLNEEELRIMEERLKQEPYFENHVIKSINNPAGRIKFKDVRKLSVGIAKKDIMSYRSKKKSAFYNCFVMILRINIGGIFREFHVKIFNTGKIELPGMQTDEIHTKVLAAILEIITPLVPTPVYYLNASDTILINSNFNCGFFINREALYHILKNKYNIETIYDPCSYPGIQCKFYYNESSGINLIDQRIDNAKNTNCKLVKVSFMIFRTGSVLIVGMCNEHVLMEIYSYIKTLLQNEYHSIGQITPIDFAPPQNNNKKIRKKLINVNVC